MGDAELGALLPLLTPRELWALGLVVVLGVLRPVRRLGWAVAAAIIAGAVASIAAMVWPDLGPGLWLLLPWAALAALLLATAAGRPLRWEPRSGPSSATALLFGALVVHVGAAWHGRGGLLAEAAGSWLGGGLTAADLGPGATGPLALVPLWAMSRLPGVDGSSAVALSSLAAAAVTVWGASVLARNWGYTGTGRATAAAVAWAPPLLIAYLVAPGALIAAAALVWSWWALGEVWTGRHLPDRMALLGGALLGAAVGVAIWPIVVGPLWVRRLGGRKLGWLVVGFVAALVAAVATLIPTEIGLADLWHLNVTVPGQRWGIAVGWVSVPLAVSVLVGLPHAPLSPTRLSAVTGALLVLTLPWWPAGWAVAGPVVALPFVLLAAVAPDRPTERWPPDAPLGTHTDPVEVRS